jgi:hypothetical protein
MSREANVVAYTLSQPVTIWLWQQAPQGGTLGCLCSMAVLLCQLWSSPLPLGAGLLLITASFLLGWLCLSWMSSRHLTLKSWPCRSSLLWRWFTTILGKLSSIATSPSPFSGHSSLWLPTDFYNLHNISHWGHRTMQGLISSSCICPHSATQVTAWALKYAPCQWAKTHGIFSCSWLLSLCMPLAALTFMLIS